MSGDAVVCFLSVVSSFIPGASAAVLGTSAQQDATSAYRQRGGAFCLPRLPSDLLDAMTPHTGVVMYPRFAASSSSRVLCTTSPLIESCILRAASVPSVNMRGQYRMKRPAQTCRKSRQEGLIAH